MEQNGYIDIGDIPVSIPGGFATGRYPWKEWGEVPPGKALEITEHVKHLKHPNQSLARMARLRGLRVIQRGTDTPERRVFITRRKP